MPGSSPSYTAARSTCRPETTQRGVAVTGCQIDITHCLPDSCQQAVELQAASTRTWSGKRSARNWAHGCKCRPHEPGPAGPTHMLKRAEINASPCCYQPPYAIGTSHPLIKRCQRSSNVALLLLVVLPAQAQREAARHMIQHMGGANAAATAPYKQARAEHILRSQQVV